MTTNNQTSIEIFRKIAQDQNATATAQAAQACFGRVYAGFAEMQSFDFLLIAVNRHPHASPHTAVKLLSEECDSFVATAKSLRAEFQRTRVSEKVRLESVDAIVLKRSKEIDASIQDSFNMRISALNQIERDAEKLQKMREAGLSKDQIDLIADIAVKPDEIQQIYEASVEPLILEREAIARFRKTFDETQLPSVILDRVHKAQTEAVQ